MLLTGFIFEAGCARIAKVIRVPFAAQCAAREFWSLIVCKRPQQARLLRRGVRPSRLLHRSAFRVAASNARDLLACQFKH
jgi:hypothetical protein